MGMLPRTTRFSIPINLIKLTATPIASPFRAPTLRLKMPMSKSLSFE
jgi:hypothetical protein